MRQPKYDIGTILYNAYTFSPDQKEFTKVNRFFSVPAIAIITNININREDITYTLKEYKAIKDGHVEHEIQLKESSEEFGFFSISYNEIVQYMTQVFETAFVNLTREMNKEKLSDVLHGK